jgi:hypothetical protein
MMGKRGISEIAAAMLLITIAVAASIIIYIYSSGLLGSLQGAGPQQGQYTNQIVLEYYDWSKLSQLVITLRNVGSGIAVFAAFYVSGTSVEPATGSTCFAIGATVSFTSSVATITTLNPSFSCKAVLNVPFTVTSGLAYIVKVATRDGGVFSFSCIAGKSTGS